ncbi:fimbrillin family protein [Pedobacter antarcticus]|uniref:fimbrillin family protein n=1 Tax=Pedobacter antarcticus TaxID=34086 RepID=UPI000690BF57|nr:fimbrillin family protein [Pedobacter antarcticus]
MKIKNLHLTTIFLLVLFGTACRKDRAPEIIPGSGTAVKFSSSINGEIKTKAVDNSWNTNDNIGVFMKTGSGLLNALSVNKMYSTPGDGEFTPVSPDQTIYYPEDGSTVDFIAYYPYMQALTSTKYPVDVTNQTIQSAIDLLYADNAVNLSKVKPGASLIFSHQLSKVEFTVKNGTGVSNLNELSVSLADQKTTAEFDLATGSLTSHDQNADIQSRISVRNGLTIAEAILIPSGAVAAKKVVFTVGEKNFSWKIPADTKFEKGKNTPMKLY